MKDLVKKAGLASQFHIESAATSREEIGKPGLSSGAAQAGGAWDLLRRPRGAPAHKPDYDKYDLLIGMDSANLRNMYRICGGDFAGKLHLLMDYTDHSGDVAEPVVHRGLRVDLAGCVGGLPGIAERIVAGVR